MKIENGILVRRLHRLFGFKGAPKIVETSDLIQPVVDITSGNGFYRIIALGSPAAGANFSSINIPNNKVWRIISLSFIYTTSAVAANRKFILQFRDAASNIFGGATQNNPQTASSTIRYYAGFGLGIGTTIGTGLDLEFPLPFIYLMPGYQIVFTTNNEDATDQYSSGIMLIEEFDLDDFGGLNV